MAKNSTGDDAINKKDAPENQDDISWDDVMDEPAASQEPSGAASKKVTKQAAEFGELKKKDIVASPGNLDFILDIPLEVTVELGRTNMPIYDLLQMGQGSIIELNKIAGEPLDILINQKLIAKGEVVVVNEKFGIRLTDVVSPRERVEKLT
jgi:flagellar motor switch protein FliN